MKFILLIACLFCLQRGFMFAEQLESSVKPIDIDQVVLTEEGLFIIDDLTNALIPIVGFIQNGQSALGVTDHTAYIGRVKCEHRGYACTSCYGCFDSKCWNRCSCKKK